MRLPLVFLAGILVGGALFVDAAPPADCSRCVQQAVFDLLEEFSQQGWMGLGLRTYPNIPGSLLVKSVQASSPASLADIREGDLIVAVNGVELSKASAVATIEDYRRIQSQIRPGDRVVLSMMRDDGKREPRADIEITAEKYSFAGIRYAVGSRLVARAAPKSGVVRGEDLPWNH